MSVQPALDPDAWDIYLGPNGDLALATGGAQVAQHVRQRISFHQDEWFLNLDLGLPWLQEILGARRFTSPMSDRAYSESYIKTEILGTPGVTRLLSFGMVEDRANRTAEFKFQFDTDYGDAGTEFFKLSLNRPQG